MSSASEATASSLAVSPENTESQCTVRSEVSIADFQTIVRSPARFSSVDRTLSIAMASRIGVSIELCTTWKWKVCDGKSSELIRIVTGTIFGASPKLPRMPVDRSCETEPRMAPVVENLKER